MNRHAFAVLLALAAPLSAQNLPCFAAGNTATFEDLISMGGPNLLVGIQDSTGNTPLTIHAIDVFTGERAGPSTLGLWSHDAANNQPLMDLGTGSFTISSANGWQGCNLPAPITLPANTTFWLVWGPQNGCQGSIEARNSSTGQPYRGSFDGGQSWNGPFVAYDWKFRLWCSPQAFPAFSTFGRNCPGSGRTAPRIGASALPSLGATVDVTLAGAQPSVPAFGCLGYSDALWQGGIPLPFDMGIFGAPGCSILVDLLAVFSATTDARGSARQPLTVPNQPALLGVQFYAQWFAQDLAANALGLVTSDGGKFTIGQ